VRVCLPLALALACCSVPWCRADPA
jgi:hypothetical protein